MPDFPFVYLHHGALDPESFGKVDEVWIAFAAPVSGDVVATFVEGCPAPLYGFFHADDAILHCETGGDHYEFLVRTEYGEDGGTVSAEGAAAFSADVEAWVRGVHERAPIAFVIGPGRPLEDADGELDAWAHWSTERIETVVVPWLEWYADTHPDLPDENDEDDGEVQPMDRYTLSALLQHLPENVPGITDRLDALADRLGWS